MSPVWRNHTGNQSCEVVEERSPETLEELVELVREAEGRGLTIRAVGAGHAWSDVALTEGIVVRPDRMTGIVEQLSPTLVRVKGGTHLHQLNAALRERDLALPNMGGYDAQTIAGVVATSTHGSGLTFGPFPDMVRSIDLVVSGGEVVRVEPSTGGPTAPGAFAGGRLIADDDVFRAAICGMGTLGLVWALAIEIRDAFWLEERREVVAWEAIRDTVTPAGILKDFRHYELFLNPYKNKDDGTHHVLVTTREDIPRPPEGASPGRGLQHPLTELASGSKLTGWMLRWLARHRPQCMVQRFDGTLKDMQDPSYKSISYMVFNIGEANKLPAYSMELGVTLEDDRHLACVDRILEIAARWAREGVLHTSPIALRFVAPSRAYASMMADRPTMMIELIMVVDSHRGEELLASYERELGAAFDARPHWGQLNALTSARAAELYPDWERWRAVERELNASGVFDSPFTRRVGIS